MRDLRYPAGAIAADYVRAAIGVGFCGTPVLFVGPTGIGGITLSAFAALFLVYGARTALRHVTRVELSEEGLRLAGPWPRHVKWADLQGFSLKYYATRRDREGGWMQLRVTDARAAIGVDSTLEGFPEVVRRAVAAAQAVGLEPTAATRDNLAAMRIGWPQPGGGAGTGDGTAA